MLITRIVFVAALLSLGACASSPKYVAADGAYDYGHQSRQIAENRYRVNFNGGQRASLQDTRDFALLRAAELTLAEGNDWFQVIDRETATTETRDREPRVGFGYERAWTVRESCGVLSCTRSTRPASYARFDYDTRRPAESHSHSIEIVMGKGKVPEDGHYYDAREVVKSLYNAI